MRESSVWKDADGSYGPEHRAGHGTARQICLPLGRCARQSLAKEVIAKYDLQQAGKDVQKFGVGMKEIWEIDPAKHKEGTVTHTMGWPLGKNAGGGSFIYHLENNQVYVGFVVHLNYKNPHLFPYMEFQRFKHHPDDRRSCWKAANASLTARARSPKAAISRCAKMVAHRRAALLGLLGRHGQRAAHQGQPQRDAVGQGRCRSRPCRDPGWPRFG